MPSLSYHVVVTTAIMLIAPTTKAVPSSMSSSPTRQRRTIASSFSSSCRCFVSSSDAAHPLVQCRRDYRLNAPLSPPIGGRYLFSPLLPSFPPPTSPPTTRRMMKSQRHAITSSSMSTSSEVQAERRIVEHMLYRLNVINDVPYDVKSTLIDFTINGRVIGKVTQSVADKLCTTGGPQGAGGVFVTSTGTNRVTLTLGHSAGNTFDSRTRSVGRVMDALRNEGYVAGWRNELYPVGCDYDECRHMPYFLIERSCASLLGVMEYGVHVNGIVIGDGFDGSGVDRGTSTGNNDATRMWLARRSNTKSKYPGYVDHIAAGGLPYGISIHENAMKECHEEAGIPIEISSRSLRPAGAICYENYERVIGRGRHEGVMNRVVLFCYDLVLPTDFVPTVVDGEVESFFTWSMEELCESLDPSFGDPMKPNCYPVIIDYLLRSGRISPDTPGYLDVLHKLRSGSCH